MNEIEFLEDIPEKSRTKVACLYNENIFLREQVKSLQRLVFAQKSERFVGAELILQKKLYSMSQSKLFQQKIKIQLKMKNHLTKIQKMESLNLKEKVVVKNLFLKTYLVK